MPLALSNSITAGSYYLVSVAVGLLGNVVLRRSVLSFVPWAVAFALYPAFLSYGGWGGGPAGSAPVPAMVALAALLGVGVHVLSALPDLVADNKVGYRHLPLRIALRTGATRLLVLGCGYVAARGRRPRRHRAHRRAEALTDSPRQPLGWAAYHRPTHGPTAKVPPCRSGPPAAPSRSSWPPSPWPRPA